VARTRSPHTNHTHTQQCHTHESQIVSCLSDHQGKNTVMATFAGPQLNLRYMGFCGVDDSVVNPELLHLISLHYPWVEWGILFRPDLEGTPRY
jgi:hypothetical protein